MKLLASFVSQNAVGSEVGPLARCRPASDSQTGSPLPIGNVDVAIADGMVMTCSDPLLRLVVMR